MGLLDRFRKRPARDEDALREAYVTARRKNQDLTQRARVTGQEINALFTPGGHTALTRVGEMDVAGERLVICDPCYLGSNMAKATERAVPPGRCPVYAAIFTSPMTGRVVSGVKLKLSDAMATRYELAMPLGFKMWQAEDPGVFPGISIETGVVCLTDEATELPFANHLNRYYDEHPGKDLIHDELLPLTAQTGYAMWTVPGALRQVPVFAAGLGQGLYNAYWGLDRDNRPVELVLPLVYPELFI